MKSQNQLQVVHHARDGEEAIAYLSAGGAFSDRVKYPFPDVIVLDLKMPNKNGFEVLEEIHGRFPRPRIVVYTSSDDPVEVSRAFALGCDGFHTKTANTQKLAAFIESLRKLARPEQA